MSFPEPDWLEKGQKYLDEAEDEPEMWDWWLRNYGPVLLEDHRQLLKAFRAVHQCGDECLGGCAYF